MGSFIQVYTDGGGIREARVSDDYSGNGSQPFVLKFPGFRRSLLASLVASSTASRTSDIVTITATAHGIPTGATYVGFRFFYPGSAGLAAGWYDSITDVQTNTISFNAPGANFGSQSVNGAAIYTTLTDVTSITIPASMILPDTSISVVGYRGGDTSANAKQLRTYLNGLNVSTTSATATPFVRFQSTATLVDISTGRAFGESGFDNLSSATEYLQNIPLNADVVFSIRASLAAASGYIYIPSMKVLIQ